jgi:murein DD-endopeptidase MepM/ murein hydrolase activator NlpD
MVPEPSADFYKQFIMVNLGQQVKKGDTVAYMYLPPSAGIGCHIHFHMMQKNKNYFYAPAIFTNNIVDSFYEKWGEFGYDGSTPMPACMGYMLDADENPYGNGPVDILK